MKIFPSASLLALSIILLSCSSSHEESELSTEITDTDIRSHISYLASDELEGREAGSEGEARAASYIADHFRKFGLMPAGSEETYFQEFTVNMSVLNNPHSSDTASFDDEERIARNIIGTLEGTGNSSSYIVIGAHYDHLGTGKFGSLYNRNDTTIHNGADDNASGTAGVLELAQYFSEHPTEENLVFIAFSGEEMGLLGSQHYVDNPTIPLDQTMAMINMDMIGRLNDNKLLVFGTGSSDSWQELLEQANTDSLILDTIPDGVGASDHTSFYNKNIPVLHYFTDTHSDYHRPSDDTEYINAPGLAKVLQHIRRTVQLLDELGDAEITFTEAPVTQSRNMTLKGVTLGVTPDYGFSGTGMRITGVRGDGPADKAGLKGGDVIVKLDGQELKDIYAYMEALNNLEEGQRTTVTVVRDGNEQTIEIIL